MAELKILVYANCRGRAPFEKWFGELDARAQAKATVALDSLKRGNISNVSGVGDSVFELKLDWGPGYRLYFGRDGDRIIILLLGGTKKRQKSRYRFGQELLARLQVAQAGAAKMKDEAQCHLHPQRQRFGQGSRRGRPRLPLGAVSGSGADQARRRRRCRQIGAHATSSTPRSASSASEQATRTQAKSLMRMFGRRGRPTPEHLLGVVSLLQKQTGVRLEAAAVASAA